MSEPLRVAIVGAGMTGIAAALDLAKRGHHVDLYEAREHIGGLSDAYTWGGLTWDRFYHVVLSTDARLVELIRELGLEERLFWVSTKSGFFGDGTLVSMSSIGDFIGFPFLSLWQKFRLGVGILTSIGIRNPDKLDRVFVREWLTRVFGRRVYERIWDPLLRSKLGAARSRTSAAFIWATITRLYGARSGDAKSEQMGHVRGGYSTILSALERRLNELSVSIKLATPVASVTSAREGAGLEVASGALAEIYDKVLLTIPASGVLTVTRASAGDDPYWQALSDVDYLGVICLFCVLDRPLSPYYVTNLLDTTLPFTGIIEVTNIVDPAEFAGRHVIYLPKYVTSDDRLVGEADDVVVAELLAGLKRVHPDLEDASILHTALFREQYVQPLQEVNYLRSTRGVRTPIAGVFLANSTMLYNSTLNNNAAISLANRAVRVMLGDIDE